MEQNIVSKMHGQDIFHMEVFFFVVVFLSLTMQSASTAMNRLSAPCTAVMHHALVIVNLHEQSEGCIIITSRLLYY